MHSTNLLCMQGCNGFTFVREYGDRIANDCYLKLKITTPLTPLLVTGTLLYHNLYDPRDEGLPATMHHVCHTFSGPYSYNCLPFYERCVALLIQTPVVFGIGSPVSRSPALSQPERAFPPSQVNPCTNNS